MSNFKLNAELRSGTGKGDSRRIRRAGKIPAIIYGGNKPDLPIVVEFFTIDKLLNDEHFHTGLIDIDVAGHGKETAVFKAGQWHPVKDSIHHLDFLRVSATDTIHMSIPVHALNAERNTAIKGGGVLEIERHTIEVTCRADHIPEAINIDIATLKFGESVYINDVTLPEGVSVYHQHDNFVVLHIVAPKKLDAAAVSEETPAA